MRPLLEEHGYFSPHALDYGVVELVRRLLEVFFDGGDIFLGPSEGPFCPPALSPTEGEVLTQTQVEAQRLLLLSRPVSRPPTS
jgi:hypothetical protein